MIDNVFPPSECQTLIKESESFGYDKAAFNSNINNDVRNNSRVITRSKHYADLIWDRVNKFVPKYATELHHNSLGKDYTKGFELFGFSETVRFYRYAVGEYFAPHTDGCIHREGTITQQGVEFNVIDQSFITLLVYLNDVQSGGETNFYNSRNELMYSVMPKAGSVLMFVHWNCHEGATLSDPNEKKYAMRTDVLYRKIVRK